MFSPCDKSAPSLKSSETSNLSTKRIMEFERDSFVESSLKLGRLLASGCLINVNTSEMI